MNSIRDALQQYIALRRALGTKFHGQSLYLAQFLDFIEERGISVITTELSLDWATASKGAQRSSWAKRLGVVRGFATWMSSIDPRTEVPPKRLIPRRNPRKPPYIYSDEETTRLMQAAALLPSSTGFRGLTFYTLIGLLASTGIRPGEAVALNRPDVDLNSGILSIRYTKFGKSRFVPVEETTRCALTFYAQQRDKLCRTKTNAFFVCERNGLRLKPCRTRKTFAEISASIGLRCPVQGKRSGIGPRLQDFRHTFATRRLLEWYRSGLDVQPFLPQLATYLGHAHIGHTYYYIQAIPELLQLATIRLESASRGGNNASL